MIYPSLIIEKIILSKFLNVILLKTLQSFLKLSINFLTYYFDKLLIKISNFSTVNSL